MTMDDSDLATCHEELRRALAQRHRKSTGPAPTGQCQFCGEDVTAGQRWCNADCRDDWERAQRADRMRPC